MKRLCSSTIVCKDSLEGSDSPFEQQVSSPGPVGDACAAAAVVEVDLPHGVTHDGSTPLETALKRYFSRMPPSLRQKHLGMVRTGLEARCSHSDTIIVGSACTGTDIGVLCLNVYLAAINSMLGSSRKRHNPTLRCDCQRFESFLCSGVLLGARPSS